MTDPREGIALMLEENAARVRQSQEAGRFGVQVDYGRDEDGKKDGWVHVELSFSFRGAQ